MGLTTNEIEKTQRKFIMYIDQQVPNKLLLPVSRAFSLLATPQIEKLHHIEKLDLGILSIKIVRITILPK